MAYGLGIDVGSTNAKVALVDPVGAVVAAAGRPIASRVEGEIGEQDANDLWSAVVASVRELTAAHPDLAADVVTVGVCSQYSTTIPVDTTGEPTAPAVMYFDTRGTDHCWALMGEHDDAFATWVERHPIPPVGGGLSLAHVLHLQHDRPDVHERTAAYLEPMDFVNLRLTGVVASTQATQFTMQLCDNRRVGSTTYDPELLARSGVDASRLPPLIAVDGVVGPLRADVAATLGLPTEVEVRAGMNDSHAGAYATGAFTDGRAGLMVGTTAVLLDSVDHLAVDLEHEVLSMPSPEPDRWLVWAENGIAGKSLEHALTRWLLVDDALATSAVVEPFAHLDAALASSPPSARGVLFLPWLAGSLSPNANRNMRGAFLNLSLDTDRVDLVRAVVEGTAHNLAWLIPPVEAFSGCRIDDLAFGGGAARSPRWAQIVADVLDRPVHTLDRPDHAAARAVALAALHRHGSAEVDPRDGAPCGATYEPDPATRARYDEMQAQFEAAFEATKPINEALGT